MSSLRPHELALERHVKELVHAIRASGAVLRPLVVEARSLIVLDGSHRLRALQELGASLAPVALVNYESVSLSGWVRVYDLEALEDLRRIAEVLRLRRTASGSVIAWLGDGDSAYYDLLSLEEAGHELVMVATDVYSVRDPSLLVVPPRPTKDLVLKAAGSGRLLPPRSTRHLTEAKQITLRTPLSSLEVRIP